MVDAWWAAAADVDAVLRLSCPTLAALDALVADLRRTGPPSGRRRTWWRCCAGRFSKALPRPT